MKLVLAALPLAALINAPAVPQSIDTPAAVPSCTAQWLRQRQSLPAKDRYQQSLADAFGRRCLGITGPKPIDWTQVSQDLDELIRSDSPLVTANSPDIDDFCPGYSRADRVARAIFWRKFANAVIRPEAGTNANAIMWEQPYRAGKPSGGEYSIGLLQLSLSNRQPYACAIPTESSLLDPRRNLECGVKIMERLITRGGIGGTRATGNVGLASYWSTVRTVEMKTWRNGKPRPRETRSPIVAETRALPQCAA